MKTSLDIEGPEDLSVGRIRITGADGVLRDWIATPGERGLQMDGIVPGFYLAEISPAGVQPQTVVFEVEQGKANTIVLPAFGALLSNGAAMTFLDTVDRFAAARALFGFQADSGLADKAGIVFFSPDEDAGESATKDTGQPVNAVQLQSGAALQPDRLLSVGIAAERPGGRESWSYFPGHCTARVNNGRLQLDIHAPEGWDIASGRRARLSVAIQDLRIERLLLPLYRGGTTVTVTPSPLSASDVGLEVTPSDPAIRAIWRALDAGTREHAQAVRDHVLRVKGPEPIAALEAADPWEAVLAGLLYLRFPDLFGPLSRAWAEALVERYPWMADSYVIRAKQAAAAAASAPASIVEQAQEASNMLVKAHARNSPYFSLSNQYFKELVESLMEFDGLADGMRQHILRTQRRLQRELPLQRNTGVSFSWLSRDQQLLKERRILAPRRQVSGRLPNRNNTLVFEGRVSGDAIALGRPGRRPTRTRAIYTKSLDETLGQELARQDAGGAVDAPALARRPGPPDDPNLGRFGKKAAVGGFTLSAEFPEARGQVVLIAITVTAASEVSLEVGDTVWLCLHPTFKPQWLQLYFNGRSANLTVRAWGGFTVGAWLPRQQVELECDLSTLAGAPAIIRDN